MKIENINCWQVLIIRTDHIHYSNGTGYRLYVYHSVLEGSLDLEALGLGMHSLLVNPALSVPKLRVATQKHISQYLVFRTTLLSVMK